MKHSQAFVAYIFGFFDFLVPTTFGRHKKKNTWQESICFQSVPHTSILSIHSYQVLSFLCPQANCLSTQWQLCEGHLKGTLVHRLPSFQSDLCHRTESLCLLSFIWLLFLRISSLLTVQRFRSKLMFQSHKVLIFFFLHFYFSFQISHFLPELMLPKIHSQGSKQQSNTYYKFPQILLLEPQVHQILLPSYYSIFQPPVPVSLPSNC